MTIKVKKQKTKDSTDTHLMVKSLSDYEIYDWDAKKIISALREECKLTKKDAEEIADIVYNELIDLKKEEVDVQTLKMIINYHLLKNGFNGAKLSGQISVGMSLYDLDTLIHSKSNENSNVGQNSPNTIDMIVAENTMKKYALKKVFSNEVGNAHLEGLIHLHDMGCINKIYCSGHSVRSIAKYGLGKHFKFEVVSNPANSAQVLIGHINTYLCTVAKYYAGALGLDFVNIVFAPYLEGKSYKEIKQIAQYIIFSIAQSAFSRNDQTLFVDFNVFPKIPDWLGKIKAIGPGGRLLDRTYSTYEKTAQDFLMAILEVAEEGDALGQIMPFPKIDFHISKDCFTDKNAKKVLIRACGVSSKNGSPYFIFDHDSITQCACCRLKSKIEDKNVFKTPEFYRFNGAQNVSINLPQCALKANGDKKQFLKELSKAMILAKKAHIQKKEYIESISQNETDPLYELCKKEYFDGKPYVVLNDCTYLIGIVGLNECVKCLCGKELHEDNDTFKFSKSIIAYMWAELEKLKKESGLKFSLEESPAESAVRRFAKANLSQYPERIDLVQGNVENDDVYLTNSIHFRPDAPVSFPERVRKQSEFHKMIESGAIVHMFCGENLPPKESIFNLLEKTFKNTDCAQLVISPEFTICNKCGMTPGINDKCPKCGSEDVEQVTRVVGYYSKIKNWNKSKQKEREDRNKGMYTI